MFLPSLSGVRTMREMISDFGGYNNNLRIRFNQFDKMQNMSGDLAPLLSPRRRRAKLRAFTKPNGLFAHEKLCWVDGTDFIYDGSKKGTVSDTPKQFVAMGAQVLIWPDKVYYNATTGEFGKLGAKVTTSGTVTISLSDRDGSAISGYTSSATPPSNPTNGAYWIDTSVTPNVLKRYSSSQGMWSSVPTTYVKIAATGIGAGFSEFDGVTISGMANSSLNGEFILQNAASGYIIVSAIINATSTQTAAVTIERKIPDLDFVTESGNRIWGCSSKNHEVYACKLGDPKNWYSFLNISTDSYIATIGSSGDFTGCCAHLGYVLFFKEDIIYKLFGNKPSNFQIQDTICRGVQAGSEKSLIIVSETLYYKSRHKICAYNASLPASISDDLGQKRYWGASAGASGSKYYISMQSDDGPVMLVYDESIGMWHREDGIYASHFAALGAELYFINANDKCLYSVNGSLTYGDDSAKLEEPLEWYAESGDIGLDLPDNKYISKLQIRLEAEESSILKIALMYDYDGIWTERCRINMTRRRSFTVPIIPRRCDTLRIRLSGVGECRIYSLTKTIEEGSEV